MSRRTRHAASAPPGRTRRRAHPCSRSIIASVSGTTLRSRERSKPCARVNRNEGGRGRLSGYIRSALKSLRKFKLWRAAASAGYKSSHDPLDSCNENLPEKRIHRNYASRPDGTPRRVFCCADAYRGRGQAPAHPSCQDRDTKRWLQKRGAIVSGLLFTMKIPTTACGGANDPPRSRSYDSFGEYGRQVLCALQFALLIHHCVGRSYQLRDDAAAAGDRIALIASGLEEIRGGHAFAPRQRHGDDIEAIAIAGEVHHLELGCA